MPQELNKYESLNIIRMNRGGHGCVTLVYINTVAKIAPQNLLIIMIAAR